jgi:hypothetical protein
MHNPAWLVFWIAVLIAVALVTLFSVNSVRFQERVRKEGRRRLRSAGPTRDLAPDETGRLPAPVQRYLTLAIRDRARSVCSVRLRHGGRFRTRPGGGWLPIRGEQYFAADPPGFLWWGRLHVGPGVWVDARDQLVDGRASLQARLESTITVGNAVGPEIDQGGMLRLLGEMVWFPTSFVDERFVSWEAIDDRTADAALSQHGREVEATFHFRRDGLPRMVTAQRYRDTPRGAVLTPWTAKLDGYRLIDGLLVPLEVEARWHLDSGDWPYAQFKVERIEYDRQDAF